MSENIEEEVEERLGSYRIKQITPIYSNKEGKDREIIGVKMLGDPQ